MNSRNKSLNIGIIGILEEEKWKRRCSWGNNGNNLQNKDERLWLKGFTERQKKENSNLSTLEWHWRKLKINSKSFKRTDKLQKKLIRVTSYFSYFSTASLEVRK